MQEKIDEIKDISEIMKKLFNQQQGVKNKLEKEKEDLVKGIEKYEKKKESIGIQIEVLKEASIEARKNSRDMLQEMSNNALKYIMGDHRSLSIDLGEKGSSPTAEFVVVTEYDDYIVETDPAEEEGGGIADIVSFSNQIAMLRLAGKKNVAPIFFDEPTKFVSKGHSEQVASFLFDTSSHFNKQTIMVTHDEHLGKMGDRVYKFKIENGKSIAQLI